MDNVQLRYVFDRKKVADNKTKKGLLQIEVRPTGAKEKILISTGIYLYKNQFSDTNGFTCRNHNNASAITGNAKNTFNKVEAFVLSDKCNNLHDAKNWDKVDAPSYSFLDFMRDELRKKSISLDSAKHHHVLIGQLKDFGKINRFADLTYKNICDFDFFLRKTIKASSTLHKRHSTLKSYIQLAVNMELITKNPYALFKMPSSRSKEPTFLIESEIEAIKKWVPTNDKLEKTKDMFIFQMFTGMAYVDMSGFDKSYISEMDGYKIIRSTRHKTDQSFVSLFLPEAEAIAEKYDYKMPVMSNQKYNDYLKLLEAGAKITKNLTTHVARHTYATYLLNKGIPLKTVSKALGHSNTKMTEHYARLLAKTVISDMAVLLDKPEEKRTKAE